jgi:hypothetical protein
MGSTLFQRIDSLMWQLACLVCGGQGEGLTVRVAGAAPCSAPRYPVTRPLLICWLESPPPAPRCWPAGLALAPPDLAAAVHRCLVELVADRGDLPPLVLEYSAKVPAEP